MDHSRILAAWDQSFSHGNGLSARAHPILPQPGGKNVLITSALPYVNNVPHLGNIIGCVLSGDVFSRYCRQRNYNSLYICGTDEYGTATETKAIACNMTPQQICDKYHALHAEIYRWFNIDFDHFGRTTTQHQTDIAQAIFLGIHKNKLLVEESVSQLFCETCQRYLADRFVEGICPFCRYAEARGDQCDLCGKLINTVELIEPTCKICKATPVVRNSNHLFLDLCSVEDKINELYNDRKKNCCWSTSALSITQTWLREGLKPRCITRDLKWGTPVPLEKFEDKVFYVWFDAPIGYISITKGYSEEHYKKWWVKNDDFKVKLVQFMAKDNVPFHSVIFPASLIAQAKKNIHSEENSNDDEKNLFLDYNLVDDINSVEYLNYEDTKFSKSRGVGVFGDNASASGIKADIYRFYLLSIRPEQSDSSFSWSDLIAKNNNELLNNLGNFVNRSLTFVFKFFDGNVPEIDSDVLFAAVKHGHFTEYVTSTNSNLQFYLKSMEKYRFRDALKAILEISKGGNVLIQSQKPWTCFGKDEATSTDDQKTSAKGCFVLCVNTVALIAALLRPFMPDTSDAIFGQLNLDSQQASYIPDEFYRIVPFKHKINKPAVLFEKLTPEMEAKCRSLYSDKEQQKEKEEAYVTEALKDLHTKNDLEQAVGELGAKIRELKLQKQDAKLIQKNVEILKAMKGKLGGLAKK